MDDTKIYRVPVYYQVCEYVPVKAHSPEEAIEWVKDHDPDIPVHCGEAYYVDDSFEVESDPEVVEGYDEKSGLWVKESWNDSFYDASAE